MKKTTYEQILRHERLAEDRTQRRLRARREEERRAQKEFRKRARRNTPRMPQLPPICAPEVLELKDKRHHNATCHFIDSIRHRAIAGHDVKIDFSKTKRVFTCGTLLFLAEVDRLKRILGGRVKITSNYPKNQLVEKVFQQVGILKMLDKRDRQQITADDKSVFYWKFSTGTDVDLKLADPMLKGIKHELPAGYKKIVRGVEEAMTNVIHHAYELPRGDHLDSYAAAKEKRWWVFAEILDGWLYVVMCDTGIGIPRSLPKTWGDNVIDILTAKWSPRRKDIELTKKAFMLKRSRTKLRHRGKGLKDIRQAAFILRGTLWLTTNKVQLRYDFTDGEMDEPTSSYYKESIMGTLIQWSVPLKGNSVGQASDPNQLSLAI